MQTAETDTAESIFDKEYMPLIRAQYPGLLESLTNPSIQIGANHLNDLDIAIESLKAQYAAEGAEDIGDMHENVEQILDELSSVDGADTPLAPGALLLVLWHGEDDARQRMCVPIRITAEADSDN